MKVRKFYSTLWMAFAVLFLGCTAKQAHGAPAAQDASATLRSLGFYVYDKPIDLPVSTIPALNGATLKAQDFNGKISLLNFWATWCPPCRAEMPSIDRLYAQTKDTKFQIIAVNSGERSAQVASFIEKNKYSFPIYLDESNELSQIFAARGLPSTYLVNKEGKIFATRIGAMEYDQAALIKLLKELADG